MEHGIEYISSLLWDWPLIVAILATGIYFTVSCNFFHIKNFPHILKMTLFGTKWGENKNENALSTFEVFFTAIGTTAGVGNIIGVSTAISLGGPGAIFWMVLTGFIGMIIKMAEVTLAVYYRDENSDGTFEGGPMYYIEKGIGISMNFGTLKVPIIIFCIGIMSTLIITIQSYQASLSISSVMNVNIVYIAFVYLSMSYFAIYKGIKRVGRIFKVVVPIMAFIYVGSGVLVFVMHSELLLQAIKEIFIGIFSWKPLISGATGAGMAEVIRQGVSRAVYSNEAGWGTTPMIHSKASTDHPVKQGLWGAIEVFFDTIIICTTTGLVMVIATLNGTVSTYGIEGIIQGFSLGIGSSSKVVIPLTIFFFGLTTSIGWYSYYETILSYIHKRAKVNVQPILSLLKASYPIPGFLMVIYIVLCGDPGQLLWNIQDIFAGLPTFINIFAILILSNKFFDLLKDYENKFIRNKSLEETMPVFYDEEDNEYYNF